MSTSTRILTPHTFTLSSPVLGLRELDSFGNRHSLIMVREWYNNERPVIHSHESVIAIIRNIFLWTQHFQCIKNVTFLTYFPTCQLLSRDSKTHDHCHNRNFLPSNNVWIYRVVLGRQYNTFRVKRENRQISSPLFVVTLPTPQFSLRKTDRKDLRFSIFLWQL